MQVVAGTVQAQAAGNAVAGLLAPHNRVGSDKGLHRSSALHGSNHTHAMLHEHLNDKTSK